MLKLFPELSCQAKSPMKSQNRFQDLFTSPTKPRSQKPISASSSSTPAVDPANLVELLRTSDQESSLSSLLEAYLPLIESDCKSRALSNQRLRPHWDDIRSDLILVLTKYFKAYKAVRAISVQAKYGSFERYLRGCLNRWFQDSAHRQANNSLGLSRSAERARLQKNTHVPRIGYYGEYKEQPSKSTKAYQQFELRDHMSFVMRAESPKAQAFLWDYFLNLDGAFDPITPAGLITYSRIHGINKADARRLLQRFYYTMRRTYEA